MPGFRAVLIAACCATLVAQETPRPAHSLDRGRAVAHIRQLASPGGRVAGTEAESKAAGYIRKQMEDAGLKVVLEPFDFYSFVLDNAVLTAGGNKAEVSRLACDVYSGADRLTGDLAFVESTDNMGEVGKLDLRDKIVVTTERGNVFALGMMKPRAIAALSAADFERFRTAPASSGEIAVRGKTVKLRSANIVGTLPSAVASGPEIVLSAHYDSWHGPGANDNASGVAVLLELARHYGAMRPAPPATMRFVAFGAEEFGMIGAKAYLDKHQAALRSCRLLFNMDSVGGNGSINVELFGGVRNVPASVQSQLPANLNDKAMHDLDGRWVLLAYGLDPLFDSANVPDWLRAAVSDVGKELGLTIQPANNMGSDHRVFVQAGVVATNIAISGPGAHTPADAPDAIQPESLEKAAGIIAAVVEKALRVGK